MNSAQRMLAMGLEISAWRSEQAIEFLNHAAKRRHEQRGAPRHAMALPILIEVAGVRHNALLHNLSKTGARIITEAQLPIGTRIELSCGTVSCSGTVRWNRQIEFGVKFDPPICGEQMSKQLSRWEALASRLKRRP